MSAHAPGALAPKVLCVDDEPNILSSLRRLLRANGYQVLTADSGAAGLKILAEESVDVIISDMRMPEMNGAQFLATARATWPDTMRLLLTGYSEIQAIQDAINGGEIYRYITKPWDDKEILRVLHDALERRQLVLDKARLEALTTQQNAQLRELNHGLEAKVEERTRLLKLEHAATIAANAKLRHNFVVTIKIFSSMIEQRAHNLPGHTRQIAELARKMGAVLGLEARDSQDLAIAALLHDIGKIGLSDSMLQTPFTALHGETLALFRRHPVRAEELLMPLEDLRGSAAILRSQLERFDGNGFPDGLAGLAIPLGARILALAVDYYNLQQGAMVLRHLRPDEAVTLILDAAGKRYDPQVVAAFRQVVDHTETGTSAGVEVLSRELEPGMVLARDLVSREGLMLLSADHVLDERIIAHVRDFEQKARCRLAIWVRNPTGVP
ncbi:HD domain-containing phosphohydrolase [Massilia sp. S19_KUP03_FR1]|uniref:HD domain-containing phosphohydrolase n=1 Tax=Massilia sp. S19_KUP03_FR1 TaxID=3025503 RepID=UPI002FCD6F98